MKIIFYDNPQPPLEEDFKIIFILKKELMIIKNKIYEIKKQNSRKRIK